MKLIKASSIAAAYLLFSMIVIAQSKPPCVFCEIATGKIQKSQVIYADEHVVAFLSHAPENTGHVLIIPKEHFSYFTDIPDSTVCYIMQLVKPITIAIKKAGIPAEGFSIKTNVGKAAGQAVMHAHLHILPRYNGEILNMEHIISPDQELDAVAEKIRKTLME